VDPTPQGSSTWTSALRGLKLSDALQGINVTPNTLFLILFLGMGLWLYVVYWVRHHEPLANRVLGTGAAQSATAQADRRLVGRMRNALPFHTGPTTGALYVPNSPDALAAGTAAPPYGAPAAPPAPANPLPGAASAGMPASGPVSLPLDQAGPQPQAGCASEQVPGAYKLPIQTGGLTRLKTVVSR